LRSKYKKTWSQFSSLPDSNKILLSKINILTPGGARTKRWRHRLEICQVLR